MGVSIEVGHQLVQGATPEIVIVLEKVSKQGGEGDLAHGGQRVGCRGRCGTGRASASRRAPVEFPCSDHAPVMGSTNSSSLQNRACGLQVSLQ